MNDRGRVLVMTVGTGDVTNQRETLFEPLKKSIHTGEWSSIVLLPSLITQGNAETLSRELEGYPIRIVPLPELEQENNTDDCYEVFSSVIEGLKREGYSASQIFPDFTRGTKAMSAALVLAAVRHDIPVLRYITGDRDERGMVRPGTEIIKEFKTLHALGQKLLDQAFAFFGSGNFPAAAEVLPDPSSPFISFWPPEVRSETVFVRPLADFYSRWDRLDYRGASDAVESIPPVPSDSRWVRFAVTDEMRSWIRRLASPLPEDYKGKAIRLRYLVADLLANGERRIRQAMYEDAVIRAYRVLELVGQIRLFDKGMDSESLDPADNNVQTLQRKKEKEGSPLGKNKNGRFMTARENTARLLKLLGDDLAEELLTLGKKGIINATTRNKSVLVHGFEAAAQTDVTELMAVYENLHKLLILDSVDAEARLTTARSLNFRVK